VNILYDLLWIVYYFLDCLLVLFTHQCIQAQSVSSAKDRYLQRKACASSAAAPSVKKERNGSESTIASIDSASSTSVLLKKEGGIAIKRE
jgi:hypothetical protein